jgi:CRISPR-associated protein Csd1
VLLRLGRQRGTQSSDEELTMLDETNAQPAYVLGRLFAMLESLQYAAQGRTNVTIADRYYGAASSTPNTVFPLLERLSRHHLHKLRGERAGQAVNIEKRIGAILDLLPAQPFPAVLGMEEQGLFALGYYHQRQVQFRGGEALPGDDDQSDEPAQG